VLLIGILESVEGGNMVMFVPVVNTLLYSLKIFIDDNREQNV